MDTSASKPPEGLAAQAATRPQGCVLSDAWNTSCPMAGALSVWWLPLPPGTELEGLLIGHFLMGWGEAFVTGMFTAVFVAFRPEWLASWSDQRYLPRD